MAEYQTIDEFLTDARVALDNSGANSEIQERLAVYSYSPERMQEGRALYDEAVATTRQQQVEYGDKIAATAALNEAWNRAKASYNPLAQVARVAFKNDTGVTTKLALAGQRKRSLSG